MVIKPTIFRKPWKQTWFMVIIPYHTMEITIQTGCKSPITLYFITLACHTPKISSIQSVSRHEFAPKSSTFLLHELKQGKFSSFYFSFYSNVVVENSPCLNGLMLCVEVPVS